MKNTGIITANQALVDWADAITANKAALAEFDAAIERAERAPAAPAPADCTPGTDDALAARAAERAANRIAATAWKILLALGFHVCYPSMYHGNT